MTQAERLEALVRRAIENGWRGDLLHATVKEQNNVVWLENELGEEWSVFDIIYLHVFARALFGNGSDCAYCGLPPHHVHPRPCPEGSNIWPYLWEYHLQQAVISEDPIGYMYKEVFGERP